MSIVKAYLRLVKRWRWSLLLALLIGSFLLQPLFTGSGLNQLVSSTLFLSIFGGAVYAGDTSPQAARGAVALLFAALVLQVLSFLGVGNLDGPLTVVALIIVVVALVATFAELVGNPEFDARQSRRSDLRLFHDRRRVLPALSPAAKAFIPDRSAFPKAGTSTRNCSISAS